MIECLVLGDSLAVGVGQARPNCETVARVGVTSATYVKTMFHPSAARSVVISLGVNDDPTVPTLDNLRRMRRDVRSSDVVWLLPGLKEDVRQVIRTVARENGDRTVDTRSLVGPDHLHPNGSGYRTIAGWTQPGGSREPYTMPGYNLVTSLPSAGFFRLGSRASTGSQIVSMREQPKLIYMTRPGSTYGAWPSVGGMPFAAIPPRDYAFRALPLPMQAQPGR